MFQLKVFPVRTECGLRIHSKFSTNFEKYGPEKNPHLDTFNAMVLRDYIINSF